MNLLRSLGLIALLLAVFAMPRPANAFDPNTLPTVGYHTGGIAYWDVPMFANALHQGGQWLEYEPGQWGSTIAHWGNPQFDDNGYPQYLNEGTRLRAITFGLHTEIDNRPPSWPERYHLASGRVVLEWQGDADIRLSAGATYLADDSSGPAEGSLTNGRRVYRYSGGGVLQWLEVHAINPADPITEINVWLADPANPDNASLEGELFHPAFIERLHEADWGFVRTMNLQSTNASPLQDWSDRRPPTHAFMTGRLNPRAPADGSPGNRDSGIAFEQMIALANEADLDLWLCVPHLATDDFITRLARMVRFGSDGDEPYTEAQADPVYPPLNEHLRVYVEYSNEIWASGFSFPQGDWSQQQANAVGITKPQFNARRFAEVWRIFEEEFGGKQRLVYAAGVFTAAQWYTEPFLDELATYGPTLSPPVAPDVIAVTTYFSNGIQDWAHTRAIEQAATDDPWFYTPQTFDAGGGTMRPLSIPATDAYWTSGDMARHLDETFAEWTRRMLSGDAREGGGPDAVGFGGGFPSWMRDLAANTFPAPVPIIAYEGGPSIYTDYMDAGDPRDDGITTFMEALNRHPAMRDVYHIHLNMAVAKGLWTHVIFTDASRWGKFGQWGHLEYFDQPNAEAPKYQFILDWMQEAGSRNHVDHPEGAVPAFTTDAVLPVGVYGEPYEAMIEVASGDGGLVVDLVGSLLMQGLVFDPLPGDANSVRLHGTATEAGVSYLYLRVCDEDGDCAWRTYQSRTVGGPRTILEINFEGVQPVQNLPWTNTFVLANDLDFAGIAAGTGIIPQPGDDAIVWSVNSPPDEVNATLELAITNGQYLEFTIAPSEGNSLDLAGDEMRFTIRRLSYHAPRRYSVFSSISGLAPGDQLYQTSRITSEDDQELAFTFPDAEEFRDITEPVTLHIVGHSAQYGGHATSLRALRLDGVLGVLETSSIASWLIVDE